MKIRTRIATAVTVALASVFVAAPAFAHGGHDDTESMFSSAGQPVDVVAISIVGVVLLAVILIGSTLVGNLFEKKR
ncbi:hypothetical protein MUN78_08915 [Leucobacter allii]|uniref:Uncharacterized protein n=1 Tax=Leucobacter allii TaxID=2932247 RepID=A0ABY4FHH5_9MICO|nr:hypothetical protein [Leucobacter allii]UOQ55835.1 hypothetical protein MUN78_08915 [Leucobacter allii]UOR00347.1 hypothetical protein MUN77_09160 [Leucobacter allii]